MREQAGQCQQDGDGQGDAEDDDVDNFLVDEADDGAI